ncbi:MAG: alpha-ketoglutarate-dependent dioxygenase AlkB family protein [Pseudomonadales bacterium]
MLSYRSAWIDSPAASALQDYLRQQVCWRQESLQLYGRRVRVPRQVAWFGDVGVNYRYAGADHRCAGWLPPLERLRARLADELGWYCNLVLLNRYRGGDDYMGWHADDERGHKPPVASVSLGATRRFLVRPRDEEDPPGARRSLPLDLEHGSLLLMDGRMRHTLPKTRRPVPERINLTYRCIAVDEA